MLATVADRAHALLGATLTTGTGQRPLEPADVAVVVSHNAQASVVHALLRGRDVDGVTVGTADSLQGGQWAAVVALDPLTGTDGLPAHAASAGPAVRDGVPALRPPDLGARRCLAGDRLRGSLPRKSGARGRHTPGAQRPDFMTGTSYDWHRKRNRSVPRRYGPSSGHVGLPDHSSAAVLLTSHRRIGGR